MREWPQCESCSATRRLVRSGSFGPLTSIRQTQTIWTRAASPHVRTEPTLLIAAPGGKVGYAQKATLQRPGMDRRTILFPEPFATAALKGVEEGPNYAMVVIMIEREGRSDDPTIDDDR